VSSHKHERYLIYLAGGGLIYIPSAGAVTCYKCYTLVGLLDLMDFTYAVGDLMLWGGWVISDDL
jgi:hypothetical protein